ncbi:hypothetical protein EW026_g5477 [Hermanssonia centrifuga]|uniref:Uncharacterized protein n=1 Tax=Hermanssonia centrifuga TaxID=98765 RepID=A0A4S4KFR0_9APHY|nr:hypothetical protein EW026_g5477 [Hermanssonia centrifuga]
MHRVSQAHHLTRAVYRDLLPQDQQTLSDYGFTKALTAENQGKLFGLYVGLIKFHDIKPHILHEWRIDGTLVRHIKETYEAIPEGSRGGYYPWFLENQYVLDSSLKPPSPEDYIDTHQRRAWTFIGGSETDTVERIIAQVKTWPENKARCYELYGLLLARWHPSPEHDLWLPFGFCVTSEVSEKRLGGLYMNLIRKCTFEEFHTAFEESKLIALMDSKGFRQERLGFSDLESVLKTSPHRRFSVWILKQLVYSEERGPGRTRSVFADYGFMNCADEMERADLKRVYKEYFETWSLGEPLKLHEACIKGKIYEHVSGVVKRLKKDVNKYKRLMKNMYPLPDL